MFTVRQIVQITAGELLPEGDSQLNIGSVHFDSRKIEDGSLFVALTGGARDGHRFVGDAKKNGAVAALISDADAVKAEHKEGLSLILVSDTEKAFQQLASAYRDQLNARMIAITGSNGKTTAKDMTWHLLAKKHNVFKTFKNLNNHLGLPLSVLKIKTEDDFAVLELGMNHAGEIDRLAQIARPNISIITNVGDAHIGNLGSRENIARAKSELLPHTDPNGYVLLNGDDPYVTKMGPLYAGTKYVYSLQNKADIYATEVQAADSGMFFRLHIGEESVSCFLPMYGFHNVSNLLPAALIAFKNGMQLEEIRDALLDMTISDMRFKVLRGPGDSILINDAYNASPSSMKASLDTFQHVYPGRRKVVVLGDIYELGQASEQLHTEVGQYLAHKPFEVITVGKDASYISSAAGGRHAASKEDAVNMLRPYLCADYALLFKASRGMALETLIEDLRNEVQYT